jgi:hypothetical protein
MELSVSKLNSIIRGLFGPHAVIYNDRLQDGRRSIKVAGSQEADYDLLRAALERHGYAVAKQQYVCRERRVSNGRGQIRWRLYVGRSPVQPTVAV